MSLSPFILSAAPAGASTNETVNQYLGAAGPSGPQAPWAMISLGSLSAGGPGALNGNVAVASGSATLSSPLKVSGSLYAGSGVSYTSSITPSGGETSNPGVVSAVAQAAESASSTFSRLTSTQTTGTIGDFSVLLGSSSSNLNVINASAVDLTNGVVSLLGNSSSVFVINVAGNFSAINGGVVLLGGVQPENVVWNIGGNLTVSANRAGLFAYQGTALAVNGSVSLSGGTWNGEIVGGTITQSGSVTVNSFPAVPLTQTIAGNIYLCLNGHPTNIPVLGGTLNVTQGATTVVPTQYTPLQATSVPAGTYTMTETNPWGLTPAPGCGTFGSSQTVVVPPGGAAVATFYVGLSSQNTTTPSLVQSAYGTSGESGSGSVTLSNAPTPGDLLIAEVETYSYSTPPNTITATGLSDGSSAFTLRERFAAPDGNDVTVWTLPVTAGMGQTITDTPSSAANMGISVLEYSGLSGAIDGVSASGGYALSPGATVTSGAGAQAQAGDLVLGFEADSGWFTDLAGDSTDGYSTLVTSQYSDIAEFLVESQIAATAGTYSADSTITYTPATTEYVQDYGMTGVPWEMVTLAFARS